MPRSEPLRCALCSALLASFVSSWKCDRRAVQAQRTSEAVCEPCILMAVEALNRLDPLNVLYTNTKIPHPHIAAISPVAYPENKRIDR